MSMLDIVLSLGPIFLVIALGQGLRRTGVIGAAFWPELDRLNYYVLFPAMIVTAINAGPLTAAALGRLSLVAIAAIAAGYALLELLRLLARIEGRAFTSVVQGMLRWNGFIAVPMMSALLGEEGLALAGATFLVLVPVLNVLSVLVLLRYGQAAEGKAPDLLPSLARNPLIWACLVGLALNWSGLGLPAPLGPTADVLGQAAVACGLLAVGAALDAQVFRTAPGLILAVCGLKLALMPLLAFGFGRLLGADGLATSVAVLALATPTATSSYTLARLLGGDAPLMAALITATTVGSALSLPLVAWFLL
ncbi:MAG: AEC family transporter [Alphaproteobacteria bacterium]|nr:AEC family transporter [Alphaproteobacteria bacterium]